MNPTDFCYWLKGYLDAEPPLHPKMVRDIKEMLDKVAIKEISSELDEAFRVHREEVARKLRESARQMPTA